MDNEQIFQDMVKQMTFNCTSLPSVVAERALIKAMRMMTKKANILQHRLKVRGLQNGVSLYDFSDQIPEGYEVREWEFVFLCKCKLKHIDKCNPCPVGFDLINKTCIELHPCPNNIEDGDLEICLILRPGYDLCEIPDQLIELEDEIMDGAMAEVMSMPKKPWSDPRGARDAGRRFNAATTTETARARGNNQTGQKRMKHGFI